MNMHVDINSRPIIRQYDPDYLAMRDAREEAKAQAREDYVALWLDSELYDDGDTYAGPLEALVEDDAEVLGDLLRAWRCKADPEAFDHAAGRVARALEKHVKAQA